MEKLLLKYLKLVNEYTEDRTVALNYPGVLSDRGFEVVTTKVRLYTDIVFDLAVASGIDLEFITESKQHKGYPITYTKIVVA